MIPVDETGPGALQAQVPVFIDRQLQSDWGIARHKYMHGPFLKVAPELGDQNPLTPAQIWQHGIAATDTLCASRFQGKHFAGLDAPMRDAILLLLESGAASTPEFDSKGFFALMWQNVREGFFADPQYGGNAGMAGWALIGFPGARADFADWMGRNEVYPLAPVDIQGKRSGT